MNAQRGDYEVGYGRPPKSGQFQPGESGNRRGRPRRKKTPPPEDLTDSLARALLKDTGVVMDGVPQSVPLFVAYAEKLVRESLNATVKEKLLIVRFLDDLGVLDRVREL